VGTIGFVPAAMLPRGPYEFDRVRRQLFNRRTGRKYKPGDTLKVYVCRVDVAQRQIDFAVADDAVEGNAMPSRPQERSARQGQPGESKSQPGESKSQPGKRQGRPDERQGRRGGRGGRGGRNR
jgi:ribonuclease R